MSIEKEINSLLNPLNEQKRNISLSLKALSILSQNIKQNTIKYQKDIESQFNKIIEQIHFEKQKIFNKLSLIQNKKLSVINQQHKTLIKSQQIINNAITECNEIIHNKTDNLKHIEKKQKVRKLSNDIITSLKSSTSKINIKDRVKYIINKSNTSSVKLKISYNYLC